MLQIDKLTFSFEGAKPLFYQLSLVLERGKLHRLKGRNGSGKSTLFGILQGEIPPQAQLSGTLTLEGEPLKSRGLIACVNQRFDSMLADQLSFEENLRCATLPPFPLPWRRPHKTPTLPAFLNQFGIDPNQPVHRLSGGQRQILALLMILQRKPRLLLLDEPTAALDATNARLVFEFLRCLIQEEAITMLLVCHDDELASYFCDGVTFELVALG